MLSRPAYDPRRAPATPWLVAETIATREGRAVRMHRFREQAVAEHFHLTGVKLPEPEPERPAPLRSTNTAARFAA